MAAKPRRRLATARQHRILTEDHALMLWLGVHLPAFGLEVATGGMLPAREKPLPASDTDTPAAEEQAAGHASAQPMVLVRDQRVVACNDTARALGIAPGNSLATARSLTPDTLRHLQQNDERESRRLALLADVLYRFSAEVSLVPPGGIVLEVGRSLKLFGNVQALVDQVNTACAELGHQARTRPAATPLAALALARANVPALPQVRLDQLALPAKTVERLGNMGLTTLGQLLTLPRRELAQRFGRDFAAYLERLTGERPDPRPCIQPTRHFAETLHLLEPLRDKAAVQPCMHRLLTTLSHWLIGRQLGAEVLRWTFGTHAARSPETVTRVSMTVRFAQAQRETAAFAAISALKLSATELPEDVLDIRLEAQRLRAWKDQPTTLFPELEGGPARGSPATLVDQLDARLGDGACLRLTTLDRHAPEQAGQSAGLNTRQAAAPAPLGRRPLWLFPAPRPVRVDNLVLLEGPERIQGHWWDNPLSRDYFVAVHRGGTRCWVFVDQTGQWYLHGYFA
ncbi:MAG: DNA polymerase Y family protein [Pseudomonadales bacterium]|nr:DNA polymerase Y family protein [Pseudomonadales bacterium]MCP5185760.1 DNA polymerase Y family protein [Pseudomonadales bacterium]